MQGRDNDGWHGPRIELNAPRPVQFIGMIEEPLTALGATKFVLAEESLSRAYRRACRGVLVQEAADQAAEEVADRLFAVSDDIASQVAAKLEGTTNTWDDAVWELACHQRPAEINAEEGGE